MSYSHPQLPQLVLLLLVLLLLLLLLVLLVPLAQHDSISTYISTEIACVNEHAHSVLLLRGKSVQTLFTILEIVYLATQVSAQRKEDKNLLCSSYCSHM